HFGGLAVGYFCAGLQSTRHRHFLRRVFWDAEADVWLGVIKKIQFLKPPCGERESCVAPLPFHFRRVAAGVLRRRCRSRTPGPPPFSSMKSTPALSKARLITSEVARRGWVAPASSW